MKKKIHRLYDNIENIWKHIKKNATFSNLQKINNIIVDIDPNGFICSKIVKSIKSSPLHQTTFIAQVEHKKKMYEIQITVLSKKKHDLKTIGCVALVLPVYFGIDRKINITLIMDKSKKMLPKKKETVLTAEHVNSGYCYNNSIVIYREEEHQKLILHEMIHALDIDSKYYNLNKINKFFNINRNNQINEAFTEFWTNIIYTILWTIQNQNKRRLLLNLENEINFSFLQIAKIISHFRFDTAEDLLLEKNITNKFKQDTNVFSYYIVKGCLLENYELWCNHTQKRLFNINESIEEKIIKHLQRKTFCKRINKMIRQIEGENNYYLLNTMRMTYHG